MKPIQILMDEQQLEALEQAARLGKTDRSKLIRAAVARYLTELEREQQEARCIEAYDKKPLTAEERQWAGMS